MTACAPHKALSNTLTKIKALTAKIARDSEYWNTAAGQSLKYYNQGQGQAGLARKTRQLRRQTGRAARLSYLVDDRLGTTVRAVCETTASVLACCDHFTRWREWPGQEPLNRQVALIALARSLLKQGAKK